MRIASVLAAVLYLLPALAHAQIKAEFGPRGEVTQLSVGELRYFQDIAVSLVKPGWSGQIVDQRTLDPTAVTIQRTGGTTVYSATLRGEGCRIRLREIAEVTPDSVTLKYELTPEQDVQPEAVLLQGTMPAEVHAGRTRYLVADAGVSRGLCPAQLNRDSYVTFGGCAAEWVGFTRGQGPALRVIPSDLTLQFQDNRKWNSPSFALLAVGPGGRLAAGKTVRFAITYALDTGARLEADARRQQQGDLAGIRLADNRPLAIGRASFDPPSVETYGTIELAADVAATYENPFDPEQIAVDAEVTAPDGKTAVVPGFYYVPMRLETKLKVERLRVAGPPGFRVRYTPTTPGKHRLVLRATDRSGTVRSTPLEATVAAGGSPGFIRVAKDSPRYFAFDSGRSYFAVGENICWAGGRTPLADYAAWLKGLGAAGGNWARLWLAYNEKGLEWMPAPTPKPGAGSYLGLGRYAMDNAWRLDEVVRLARENGVYLMFCLGTYGEFTDGGYFNEGCWISNPYNARNGGPCAKPEDFWTNPEARKLYQRRLRYLVARWGCFPNLFAWEFWNEVPATPERGAWVAEMAACLKRCDPNRHLVSTTYGDKSTWNCPDVDFTMQHMYGQAGHTADFTPRIVSEARAALAIPKPYLLAEFGIDWQTGDNRWDPRGTGINMHNGAWASMLSGAAGTSMLWYWDGYVHPLDVYHVLTPVRKFADTVDWATTRFRPIAGIRCDVGQEQPETFHTLTVPASVEWGTTPSSRYTVLRDGSVEGGPVAMTIGSPKRGNTGELPTRLTWTLDMPKAGKVIARLGQVCSRARLEIALDGQVQLARELPAGEPGKGPWKSAKRLEQWKVWVSDYDEDIAIEVPAGRHDLVLANTDGDWLQIRSLSLPAYRSSRYPSINAVGLASDRLILLWLHNSESTWRTAYENKQPPLQKSIRARVPADGGIWRVDWWDTFRGQVIRQDTVQVADGLLTLAVPDFASDLGARAQRLPASTK